MALKTPLSSNFIQAMSSPTHSTFQPGIVGFNMAKLVFPHADGNAAAMYFLTPAGLVIPRISMCSASQPSRFAMIDPRRSAKHFLPSKLLPPYPLPYEMTSFRSGMWLIMVISGLHGQLLTTCRLVGSGTPTVWRHFTNTLSSEIFSSTFMPIRVIILMEQATYGESVNSMPTFEIGPPMGPILYGITYMVRPFMQPGKRRLSSYSRSTRNQE